MFLVFNKQKIYSYIVAFSTVLVLLGMAKIYLNKSNEFVETFSNINKSANVKVEDNLVENNIIIKEWNDEDVEKLLQILKKYNINTNFYITNEWKNNHNFTINKIINYGYEIIEYNCSE